MSNLQDALSAEEWDAIIQANKEANRYRLEKELATPEKMADTFEQDIFKLINQYCEMGLKNVDLVRKMQYITKSCTLS
jgi:hypothetical protein